MKFSNIVKAVKGYNKIKIFCNDDPNREQWLSDGCAAYALENMPYLTPSTFPTAANLNWSADRIDKLPFPEGICFDDNYEGEALLTQSPIGIDCYVPFFTETGGLLFINEDYFRAFKGENLATLGFYNRVSPTGGVYIAVKRGLICIAVILPVNTMDVIAVSKENVQKLLDAMTFCQNWKYTDEFGLMLCDNEGGE